jgi:hypothetical protein
MGFEGLGDLMRSRCLSQETPKPRRFSAEPSPPRGLNADLCASLTHAHVVTSMGDRERYAALQKAGRACLEPSNGNPYTREGVSSLKAVPNHSAFRKQNQWER